MGLLERSNYGARVQSARWITARVYGGHDPGRSEKNRARKARKRQTRDKHGTGGAREEAGGQITSLVRITSFSPRRGRSPLLFERLIPPSPFSLALPRESPAPLPSFVR